MVGYFFDCVLVVCGGVIDVFFVWGGNCWKMCLQLVNNCGGVIDGECGLSYEGQFGWVVWFEVINVFDCFDQCDCFVG